MRGMRTTVAVLVVACALAAPAPPAAAQDTGEVLQAAAEAMGDVDAIRYSGHGWVANVGQSHTPADDWPRFEMTAYDRTISYGHRASYEIYVRRQGDYPALGGGTPLQGEQQRVFFTAGEHAWTLAGDNPRSPSRPTPRSGSSTSGCHRMAF